MLNAGSLTVNRKNVDQVRGKPRPSADIKIVRIENRLSMYYVWFLKRRVAGQKQGAHVGRLIIKGEGCNEYCKFW